MELGEGDPRKLGNVGGDFANKTIDLKGEKTTIETTEEVKNKSPKIEIEAEDSITIESKDIEISASSKIDLIAPRINSN